MKHQAQIAVLLLVTLGTTRAHRLTYLENRALAGSVGQLSTKQSSDSDAIVQTEHASVTQQRQESHEEYERLTQSSGESESVARSEERRVGMAVVRFDGGAVGRDYLLKLAGQFPGFRHESGDFSDLLVLVESLQALRLLETALTEGSNYALAKKFYLRGVKVLCQLASENEKHEADILWAGGLVKTKQTLVDHGARLDDWHDEGFPGANYLKIVVSQNSPSRKFTAAYRLAQTITKGEPWP